MRRQVFKSLRTAGKQVLVIAMVFLSCFIALQPLARVFADTVNPALPNALPDSEQKALGEWTNWVETNCNTSPSPAPAPSAGGSVSVDGQAGQQAAQKASTGSTKVGYALYDSTGKQLASYNDTFENYGASITKSMLLVAYLKQIGSGSLSAAAKSELTNMIENSDNDSANWVYTHLSSPAASVSGVASSAGMSGFKLDDSSDPIYLLGQSKITANDFAKFFSKIDTMFPATQKDFGLNLLSNLSSADQNGLLQANLPGTVYSKEGWKPESSGAEGAPYIVNQAAQFSSGGTTYGVAVTVGGTSDQSSGEDIVKTVVSALINQGGPDTTPDTTSGCTCNAGASDTTGDLTGKDNEQKIWNYFKTTRGLSDEQTAGVLGNIDDETGGTYDPEIVQGGGRSKDQPKTGGADGWGLVQWTYPGQNVQDIFNQYKGKYNISGNLYDLKTQLDIIWAQMNETSPTGVNHMIGGLKGINNPGLAATYFSDNFEGGVPGSRISDALIIYNKYKGTGGGSVGGAGGGAAGGATVTSDTLNGHKLPATTGGTGDESFFPSYALGTPANKAEDDYYITMRWRYAKWNWDGTSVPGPEDIGFYQKHPRVLVTNPRNHKSIIADALESGPAPWTGVDSGPNNTPKEGWTNPQDGTPPQYKGRVSGFPPPAIHALGAIQEMDNGATGDKLEYAWAPDQNATPGPTNLSVDNVSASGSCATVGSGSNDDIVKVAKQELALGLTGTGPLGNDGPVCKYQGSGCPQAWCADFVSWVYKSAGKPFTGGSDGGWRLSLASDTTGYFLSRKGQPDIGYGTPSGGDKMEPGWVVSFSGADPGVRGIGHVGIVTAVNGNNFDDIEGNGAGSGVSENKGMPMSSAIDWGGYK